MSHSSTYHKIVWFRFKCRDYSAFHRSSSFFRLRGGHHRNRPLPSLGIPLCQFKFSRDFLVRCHPDCFMAFSRSSSSKIPSFRGTLRIYFVAGVRIPIQFRAPLFRRPHPQKYLLSGCIYPNIPSQFRGREDNSEFISREGSPICCRPRALLCLLGERPSTRPHDISHKNIFHKTLR